MHFPHNVSFVRMCVFSPQRPTRMHTFSAQCTFPTMYHLYLCVYVPHNDQLGCTDFLHNALSPQCIVGTYRWTDQPQPAIHTRREINRQTHLPMWTDQSQPAIHTGRETDRQTHLCGLANHSLQFRHKLQVLALGSSTSF